MKLATRLITGVSLLIVFAGSEGGAIATQRPGTTTKVGLQKGASFVNVRAALIKSGWSAMHMHRGQRYEYDGTEKRLVERKFYEVDSCSTDKGSLCIFYYTRDGACLRVDTVGEQVDSMRVTRWDTSCPEEDQKRTVTEQGEPQD